mmetsp:Transcript_5189/g.6020  ORF Transcript_5189/g.6020 Transcript_5189/m.6020 type:complete len:149 (-) Transcript_5189:856-1302(-)
MSLGGKNPTRISSIQVLFLVSLFSLFPSTLGLMVKAGDVALFSADNAGGYLDNFVLVSEESLTIECPISISDSKGKITFSWRVVVDGKDVEQPEIVVEGGNAILKAPIRAPLAAGTGFIRLVATVTDDNEDVSVESCVDVFTVPSIIS